MNYPAASGRGIRIESTLVILDHRLKPQRDALGDAAKGVLSTMECTAIQVTRRYGMLPKVECYAGQLNQVFMNLISNAIYALELMLRQTSDITPKVTICTDMIDQCKFRLATMALEFLKPRDRESLLHFLPPKKWVKEPG